MTTLSGADIAHYQNEQGINAGKPDDGIDWPQLKAGSLDSYFACKATQRAGYLDPFFKTNRENAATVGFKFRLFYHWLSPISEANIAAQAAYYLSKIGTLSEGEGVMIDAEQVGITEPTTYEFKDRVQQKTGRPLITYTGYSVANGLIWKSNRLYADGSARHLAAYTSEAKMKNLPGVDPPMPDAWQYSSNGPVPGIVGRCDMNHIYNLSVFDAICGYSAQPPIGENVAIYKNAASAWKAWPANQVYLLGEEFGHVRPLTDWECGFRGISATGHGTISNDQLDYLGLAADYEQKDGEGSSTCRFVETVIPPYPTKIDGTLS